MIRAGALVACVALGACGGPDGFAPLTPAGEALLALQAPQYGAQLALAEDVAAGCARYRVNTSVVSAVAAQRARGGLSLATAVQVEADVARRLFQGRHDVVFGEDDLCAAIDTEVAAQTPLSAILIAT